jgi:tetratricopeptide (TPR) repeat protein
VAVVGEGLAHDCFLMAKAGNDPVAGIATCTEALQEQALDLHARAGTYINRGVMEVALGRTDEALGDYDRGIGVLPDMGDGYVDRGAVLIRLKRYDEAMGEINRGLGLGLSYEFAGYYNRAVAEFYLARYADSYHDYKKTLELEPDFKPAIEQLKNFVVTRVAGDAK